MKDFGPDPVPPLEYHDDLGELRREQRQKIQAWMDSAITRTAKPKIIFMPTPSGETFKLLKEYLK